MSLLLGFAGACAVIAVGSLLAEKQWARWLAYTGAHSIVVYLTFFLPMKGTTKILLWTGLIPDIGTACLVITVMAVVTPLIFHYYIKDTRLNFLYVRPAAFRLDTSKKKTDHQAMSPNTSSFDQGYRAGEP
jgi:hypothetical protein